MKNFKKYSSLLIFTLVFGTIGMYAQDNEKDLIKEKDQKKLVTDTQYAKEDLIESNENIAQLFEDAYAYVIFPNVGKGAFIAGGAAGSGIAFQGANQVGWSTLRQLDVGFPTQYLYLLHEQKSVGLFQPHVKMQKKLIQHLP